ncbi:MAG: cupin domain-containing protein [Actinomycetota bacterium]|nr:cupin domain-containing protein [Actinomycetota bacterium]
MTPLEPPSEEGDVFHRASWDWEFEGAPSHYRGHARGLHRTNLVDRSVGATHTDLGLCRLEPGGEVPPHVHSFERCIYVLGGTPTLELDHRAVELEIGSYALFPVGLPHALRNDAADEARWLELSTPQPEPDGPAGADTLFLAATPPLPAQRPDVVDPTRRYLGRYLGTPPQHEALAVAGPVRGRATAGMDSALLAYSGISVKMMVDATLGADLLTMFTVDYEPGGAAQVHDHPFEEAYFFLEGEIEAEIEGAAQRFRAGEVLFCGVGVDHGFFNSGSGRVRWVETQAPQPPRRHSYRWPSHWQQLRGEIEAGRR